MSYTAQIVHRQQIEAMYKLAADAEKFKPIFVEISRRWAELVAQQIKPQ